MCAYTYEPGEPSEPRGVCGQTRERSVVWPLAAGSTCSLAGRRQRRLETCRSRRGCWHVVTRNNRSKSHAHMLFLSPHLPDLLPIVCDGQHRPVRRWPLFGRKRPFASWGVGGGGGGVRCDGSNLSISNRCDFERFFRVTTCQQPRRLLHVSSRRRRQPYGV